MPGEGADGVCRPGDRGQRLDRQRICPVVWHRQAGAGTQLPAAGQTGRDCNLLRAELGIKDNQTIFLYQGGFSPGRGIELLLEAFSRLDDDRNVIVFMGYGPLEGAIRDFANRHPQIFLRAAVSPDVLLRYTASADYGVLFYENNCLNHYYCSPNKMFEYLMAGIPVLCADLFEMRRLVEEKGIGVVAEENTVEGFLAAVKRSLALDYQAVAANVAAARKIYNWEEQEKVLLDVYSQL